MDVWKPDVAQLFRAASPATLRPDVAVLLFLSTLYGPGAQEDFWEGPLPWADGGFCLYCEELSPRIRRVFSEEVPHGYSPMPAHLCLRLSA